MVFRRALSLLAATSARTCPRSQPSCLDLPRFAWPLRQRQRHIFGCRSHPPGCWRPRGRSRFTRANSRFFSSRQEARLGRKDLHTHILELMDSPLELQGAGGGLTLVEVKNTCTFMARSPWPEPRALTRAPGLGPRLRAFLSTLGLLWALNAHSSIGSCNTF